MVKSTSPFDELPDVSVGPLWAVLWAVVLGLAFAGLLALAPGSTFSGSAGVARATGLASVLLVLSYIDLRTGLLPDVLTYPLVLAGLLNAIWYPPGLILSIAGALTGYVIVAALAAYWLRTRGVAGIGLGDAKLLAAGGAWLGVEAIPIILLTASTSGLLVAGFGHLLFRQKLSGAAIPFGPFIALGIWSAFCIWTQAL